MHMEEEKSLPEEAKDYLIAILKRRKEALEERQKKLQEWKEWATEEEKKLMNSFEELWEEEKQLIEKLMKDLKPAQ